MINRARERGGRDRLQEKGPQLGATCPAEIKGTLMCLVNECSFDRSDGGEIND